MARALACVRSGNKANSVTWLAGSGLHLQVICGPSFGVMATRRHLIPASKGLSKSSSPSPEPRQPHTCTTILVLINVPLRSIDIVLQSSES